MNWSNIFVTTSSILIVFATIPYIVDIIKGKTKPRIVSWSIWGLLDIISCLASIVDHQYPTAMLIFVLILGNILIIILGWKHSDKKIERLDIICFIGVIFALLLWWIFNSPAVAVIAGIIISLIGAIPTIKHVWQKPQEETLSLYLIDLICEILTLLSINSLFVTAFAYPAFWLLMNTTFTLMIIFRRQNKLKKGHK